MFFTDAALQSMTERIVQLGLSSCPICHSETSLGVARWPAILHVGDHHEKSDPPNPSVNMLVLAMIECSLCGHVLLFDTARFYGGDEPILDARS